jgi:hypothetical protein
MFRIAGCWAKTVLPFKAAYAFLRQVPRKADFNQTASAHLPDTVAGLVGVDN